MSRRAHSTITRPTLDMSNSSKSLSGLKSVTRDWSDPKSSQPSDGELIDWPPTQPNIGLTPAERRLKIIQDALAEPESPPERIFTNVSSQIINKRPALSPQQPPPAKKRQLPSNWIDHRKQATSTSLSSTTWPASSSSMSSGTVRPAPVSRSSASAPRDASSGKSKV